MKRWGAWWLVAGLAVVGSVSGSAGAETTEEAKSRIAKEHEDCLSVHKNVPRAAEECKQAADEKEKAHHQKSVADTKTLYGTKLDGAALTAAIALEKQLGLPLEHTLTVAALTHLPAPAFHKEMNAKIKEGATALETKAKQLVDPHAKEISDDLSKWAKAENEKHKKAHEAFKKKVEEDAEKHKWPKAEVEKKVHHEETAHKRRFEADLLRWLDTEFHKYDKDLDAEIRTKAKEIFEAERAAWLPKVEAGIGGQTKVNMADLAVVKDKLWDHAAIARHYGRNMTYALLRVAVFHSLESDIRKAANV
jgi:hypothetical protein